MSLLELKQGSFAYGDHTIFEDISFSIEPGELFCVVGPNGCGKSTLLDCVLGLNKLQSGKLLVDGLPMREYKPRDLAQRIAYVPQDHKLTFGFSVLDIVSMGRTYEARMFEPPGEKQKAEAMHALELVGMEDFADRDYTKLSGGELQLTLIARALCQNAKVLVMDEPTAHLDFRHELTVMEIVAKLVRDEGISIMMATHFLNQAYYLEGENVPIRVALMDGGRFGAVGTPSEVLNEENLRNVFRIVTEVASDETGERKYILPLRNL